MSTTTTITNLASIASFNRGPFTTAFAPPASCLSTLTFDADDTSMYFGHANTYHYDSSCYPSSYSSSYTVLNDNGDWNQYYYSPAPQCPEAWAHATTFASYFANGADTPGRIFFSLGANTTAVLCCPSGYTYFGGAGHQCGSTVPSSGSAIHYFTTTLSNNIPVDGIPATTKVTSGYFIWGDGVPIWWQSSDLAAVLAPAKTTASSSPTSTNTGTLWTSTSSSASPFSNSGSSGLSSGAKAAIGVIIPLVMIALSLEIFFYFRRRGQAKTREANVGLEQYNYPVKTGEPSRERSLSELDNRQQVYELPGHR